MAVAVKNTAEAAPARPFDRLPIASLIGALYVIASIAIVLYGVPLAWATVVSSALSSVAGGFVDYALRFLVTLAVAAGLVVVGVRLAGSNPPKGLRAGVFVAFGGLLLIGLVSLWIGFLIEAWVFSTDMFGRQGSVVGAGLTAIIGLALAIAAGRFFFRPSFEQRLIAFEEQGWFSAASYKRTQGQRVRRGTVLGILILAGCGIYTIVAHGTLDTASDLSVSIPFTAQVRITPKTVGDNPELKSELGDQTEIRKDRLELRDLNERFHKTHVKIKDGHGFANPNDVIEVEKFEQYKEQAKKADTAPPTAGDVVEAKGDLVYQQATLLPMVKFTVPLLLGALSLWFAWRIVNLPTFADFLIATEAELNKVSWTTRKRLVQDTIVVLVTVILLTLFLLIVDALWGELLSSKYVGVLKLPPKAQVDRNKELPW